MQCVDRDVAAAAAAGAAAGAADGAVARHAASVAGGFDKQIFLK